MTRDNYKWVSSYFDSTARYCTPVTMRRAVCVFYAPLSSDLTVSTHCASVLSDPELQRASRFLKSDDRAAFLQRRAFRRYCGALALRSPHASLARIVFDETENGRPYLPEVPNLQFSFSSCTTGILGAWSSTHEIGIDIEDRTENLEFTELAHEFFSTAEAKTVVNAADAERPARFLRLWSLKEAALKSIGEGLPFGLDAFEFKLDPIPEVVRAPEEHGGSARFMAHEITGTDGYSALVTRSAKTVTRSRQVSSRGKPSTDDDKIATRVERGISEPERR